MELSEKRIQEIILEELHKAMNGRPYIEVGDLLYNDPFIPDLAHDLYLYFKGVRL